jgi:hypothetical protein
MAAFKSAETENQLTNNAMTEIVFQATDAAQNAKFRQVTNAKD